MIDCVAALEDWGLSQELTFRLLALQEYIAPAMEVELISGYRTRAEQDALRQAGRPAAPDRLSTHRTCPATGADLRLVRPPFPTTDTKAALGVGVTAVGLRWGGGSPTDESGIPHDWNHVDLGPRGT